MSRSPQGRGLGFAQDPRGNVAVAFALAVPVLLGLGGLALDYARLTRVRAGLQNAADSAALAGAREMRLANVAQATVEADMSSIAAAGFQAANVTVTSAPRADMTNRVARITLTATVPTTIVHLLSSTKAATVSASSAAQIKGGDPLCVVGLNSVANFTVKMEKQAQLQASGCVVYSNSTSPAPASWP